MMFYPIYTTRDEQHKTYGGNWLTDRLETLSENVDSIYSMIYRKGQVYIIE
jgi:hypothetical protein